MQDIIFLLINFHRTLWLQNYGNIFSSTIILHACNMSKKLCIMELFKKMYGANTVSWTAMIASYTKYENGFSSNVMVVKSH